MTVEGGGKYAGGVIYKPLVLIQPTDGALSQAAQDFQQSAKMKIKTWTKEILGQSPDRGVVSKEGRP